MPGDDDEIIIRRQQRADVDTINGTLKNLVALLPAVITDSAVATLRDKLVTLTT